MHICIKIRCLVVTCLITASAPSRNVDHPRPWEDEELMDRSSSYRSSVGRSVGTIPSYNGELLLFMLTMAMCLTASS